MQKFSFKPTVRQLLLGSTLVAIGAAGLLAPVQATTQSHSAQSIAWTQPANLADLIEIVSPAVVKITAKGNKQAKVQNPPNTLPEGFQDGPMGEMFKRYFENRPGGHDNFPNPKQGASLGSGFVVSDDGVIVTNNHVVEDADKLTVTLKDGREFEAKVLGLDPKTDLAVLKIETSEILPTVGWGNSDTIRVGDPVFAVGAPFGLSGSVTSGIVSARGREIGSGPYDDFIQVDAPINKGNSGGPLFDSKGNVVGVNTAIYSPSGGSVGIGFSIPSDLAQTIVAEIVNTGSVERGWLGVQIQDVTNDIAKSLGLEKTQGVIVSEVEDNSPAKSSGLESGDIILSFGDVEILDVGDLTLAVATSDIGKDVDMKVYRGGDVITLNANVTVLETPSDNDFGELGLALSEQGDEVIVMDIQPDSNAASTRIQKGDVLSSINQKPITSIKDVNEAVSKALKLERKSILAQIKRQDRKRFLTIPLTTS